MTESARRGMKEGLEFGLVAGVTLAVMELAAAVLSGDSPLALFRMFASIVLGQAALATTALGTTLLVGGVTHLLLAAVLGALYGLVAAHMPAEMQTNRSKQAWLGLIFGAAVWLVNFQIVASIFYPWFLKLPQLRQLVLHGLFFGLPLSLLYSAAERRAHSSGTAAGGPFATGTRAR